MPLWFDTGNSKRQLCTNILFETFNCTASSMHKKRPALPKKKAKNVGQGCWMMNSASRFTRLPFYTDRFGIVILCQERGTPKRMSGLSCHFALWLRNRRGQISITNWFCSKCITRTKRNNHRQANSSGNAIF